MGAVVEDHAGLVDLDDLPALQLDLAVDDELAGADVDVIARAAAQIFHEQPRAVIAPVEPEPGLFQPVVEVLVALLHLS
jgi:hypothetical protein